MGGGLKHTAGTVHKILHRKIQDGCQVKRHYWTNTDVDTSGPVSSSD